LSSGSAASAIGGKKEIERKDINKARKCKNREHKNGFVIKNDLYFYTQKGVQIKETAKDCLQGFPRLHRNNRNNRHPCQLLKEGAKDFH